MTVEQKIDLSTYDGPMTVVGYPDLSVSRVGHAPEAIQAPASTEQHPHAQAHHPHRRKGHH
jgi:hypothetical protein